MRGTEVTPSLRVTLAHELVHVLQDQHFDLERLDELPDAQAPVLRALGEGDAGRIEDRYVEDVLTDEEARAYEAESESSGEEATEALDESVPPILTAVFASPYIFGPELVQYLEQHGGAEEIDRALEDPPTEEVLFNPLVYGTGAAELGTVDLDAPDGAEVLDDGTFGATAWYLLLATRMEPTVALAATDGLGADAYVVYRDEERVCVRAAAGGDTPEDLTELSGALGTWVSQSPEGTAEVSTEGDLVVFRSCDPGAEAKGAGSVSVDLLALPVTRTQVYREMVDQGATEEQARCMADGVVSTFSIEQLTDPDAAADDGITDAMTRLAMDCR